MGLELIPAYGRQEEIVTLFTEYTDMLMETTIFLQDGL